MTTSISAFKHDFLENLDAHVGAAAHVRELLALFACESPDTEGILDYFRDHRITSEGMDALIRKHWTRSPAIVREANRGFREALELGGHGDVFVSHFLMGLPEFTVFSKRIRNQVHLFIGIPDLPRNIGAAKAVQDPNFMLHIQDAIARLRPLLELAGGAKGAATGA